MIGWMLNVLRNLKRVALKAALFLMAGWLLRLAFLWGIIVMIGR